MIQTKVIKEKRLRLSVFRSNKFIYAQIIDDEKGNTLVCADDQKSKIKSKIERAKETGKLLAEKAIAKKINKVYFDRGNFRYHGRIKAIAEGAREGGLEF